jgi:S-DNA-T family DNA segregation ATPase FtsK/SpoIIIE
VPTQIDSRTILDTSGAEKLLGSGDMLYSSGEGQPRRLQSSYISEDEVKRVAKYLKDQYKDELNEQIELMGTANTEKSIFESVLDDEKTKEDDELYEEARQIVIENNKASTSFLQRKLGIGYARAARLIDILEERGVVGAGNGAKPREVLENAISRDEDGNNMI